MGATQDTFVARLVRFGRMLREGGLEVGPGRLQDAVTALTAVDVMSRDDVYWAMRCTLCSQRDHLDVFDAMFGAFWDQQPSGENDRSKLAIAPVVGEDGDDPFAATSLGALEFDALEASDDDGTSAHGRGSSAAERLLTMDFREYGAQESHDASGLVERIARALPQRRSFRLEPAHRGRHVDMRRTLRSAMRSGGSPIERAWRQNKAAPRRTVFLLDVSASMSPYARAMVMFAQAAVQAGRSVEVFTFGTRLTRLTPHLAGPDRDRALSAATKAVPDWAGGTRIGANLRAFNRDWGRRRFSRGAMVVIASDGWERGESKKLRTEMAQLHRAAHTVIWVNPLAGDPRYRPLAAGMAAALPSIDVFLPGHNLAAMVALAKVLEDRPSGRRPGRRAGRQASPAAVAR